MTWGGSTGDWLTATNWSGGVLPGSADTAKIDTGTVTLSTLATTTATTIVGSANGSNASLVIQSGGTVSDTSGFIGNNAGSTGTMTVTGAGSGWTNSAFVYVGNSGTGTLTVSDLGSVTATGNLYVGSATGSHGTMTVESGGIVSDNIGSVGNSAGAIGTATVTGSGSRWMNASNFYVGNNGTGTLTVSDFGAVSAAGNVYVGSATGSHGFMTIQDGGTVSNKSSYIGSSAGSNGLVTVTGTGSKWTVSSDLAVGNNGTGSLVIQNGGLVEMTSSSTYRLFVGASTGSSGSLTVQNGGSLKSYAALVGAWAGSSGTMLVTGAGSSWVDEKNIGVGYSGTGSLTVSDSASVVTPGILTLGFSTGANGTLSILNGGTVASGGTVVGNLANSTATLIISGAGSTLTNNGSLYVGSFGTGNLIIAAGGTTNSTDAFVSAWAGSSATALVTGAGSEWTSTGTFRIGYAGTGVMTVADFASVVVSGAMVVSGTATSSGTLNIGAAHGETPVAPGTVTASNLSFGPGAGKIVFNHTSSDYIFATSISGAGIIENDAGVTHLTGDLSLFTGTYDIEGGSLNIGLATTEPQTVSSSFSGAGNLSFTTGKTFLSGDSSGFTGTTTVSDSGTLAVNGSLGGVVNVATGGRLQGSGSVESVNVSSDGTLAPGNSIGTLHMTDVTFAPGSTYEVEIDPAGNSDKIEASGTATINGGTVHLIPYTTGNYVAGTTYTILTAAGGVTGQFDAATLGLGNLFLISSLSYDANDVYAKILRNATSFASVAVSPNQKAVAGSVESLGPSHALYDAVAMGNDVSTVRAAFQSLDGELHTNIKATILEDQSSLFRVLGGRLSQAADPFAKLETLSPIVQKTNGDRPTNLDPTLWGQGFGNWGMRNGDSNAAAFHHQSKGMMVGTDAPLKNNWRVGFAFGFGHADYQQDHSNGATGKADRYSFSAYGGRSLGNLSVRTGLTYAYHVIDTTRPVSFQGYTDLLTADYEAHSIYGFGEVAYGIGNDETRVEPFASLSGGYVNIPHFSEKGGAAALYADASDTTLGITTFGARARQVLSFIDGPSDNKAVLQASLGWQHALGAITSEGTFSFAGSSAFRTEGAALARDAAIAGVGIDYKVGKGTFLGINYMGQFAPDASDHALRGNLSYRF